MEECDFLLNTSDSFELIKNSLEDSKVSEFLNLSSSTTINQTQDENDLNELSSNSGPEGDSDILLENGFSTVRDGSGDKEDSGVDCSPVSQDSFDIPDQALVERIVKQVEFYFSDENLKKDNFLLKHICRTKEGNVSLKLVSSFRKVKSITKDWRAVAYSLQYSEKLTVNPEGTKIKRKEPLPEGWKPVKNGSTTTTGGVPAGVVTIPAKVHKSVVAFNLPYEKPTMENVAELFAKCGEIVSIRILRPGSTIPADIKRALSNSKHPEIGASMCAIVEFENQEMAAKAVANMDSKYSDWRAMHVVPLLNTKEAPYKPEEELFPTTTKLQKMIKKGKKDRVEQLRLSESGDSINTSNGSDGEWSPTPRRRSSGSVCNGYSLSTSKSFQDRRGSFGATTTTTSSSARSSPNVSPALSRKDFIRPKSNSLGAWAKPAQPGGSPWVQRRLQAARESGLSGSTSNIRQTTQNDGLLRLPKGPDGTKGFKISYQIMRGFYVPSPLASVSS